MKDKTLLYEDLYNDVKHMLDLKKRNLGVHKSHDVRSNADSDTISTNSNYNNGKIELDPAFSGRLIKFLEGEIDKSFPTHTRLKSALMFELKKLVKSGNEKELLKTVKKVQDIVLKEKIKFLDSVEKKVSKILIDKF